MWKSPDEETVANHLDISVEELQELMGVAHAANVVAFDDLVAGASGVGEPVDKG